MNKSHSDEQPKKRRTTRTRFAMLHPTTPVSGLFRAVQKGAHKQTVELTVTHGTTTLDYVSPYVLDHIDWRILLAVAALCGLDGKTFDGSTKTQPYPQLWDQFFPVAAVAVDVQRGKAIAVRTSAYEVLKEAGLTTNADNGTYGRMLAQRLRRLGAATVSVTEGNQEISGVPFLRSWIDKGSGEMLVSLNPTMARPILGEQHVRVSLDDMRQLQSPAAILLHGYLSARLRPTKATTNINKAQRFQVDHLVQMVYGPPNKDRRVMSYRRKEVMAAINEIAKLSNWRVWDVEGLMGQTGDRTIRIMRRIAPKAVTLDAGPST